MGKDLSQKRTFILCGHAQSGKTSLAEAIIFKAKAVSRLGKVDDQTSVSDYEDDEKYRKSSINLSVLNATWQNNLLQFIDVPGYMDFIGDVISSAKAADFAVLVVDAVEGVQVGTEKAWEIIQRENLPCLFFINKLDKENTSFQKTVDDIKRSLTKKAVPFALFENNKVTDVLTQKSNHYYGQVVEAVAESDDSLLEEYLEKGAIDVRQLEITLKKAVLNRNLYPIVAGVATQELGIDIGLKYILEAMPSVAEAAPRKVLKEEKEVILEPKVDGPLVAQVFKTIIDPFVGQLSLFRVFSGQVLGNSEVYNANKQIKEKLGQIYFLQGKQQSSQEVLYAGDLGAVAKLKDTETLETLCQLPNVFECKKASFPPPAYSASVKPKTRQDEDKISAALARLISEDPTCKVSRDAQTKELIVSGLGELHLHVIIERMKRKYGADVELGTPKVPYKETVTKAVRVQGRYKKQTGGRGQFGDCWIEVAPIEREKDFEFVDKIVGGAIPRNYIPSVEKGIKKAMQEGLLAGFPVTDIRVTLFDGSYHPVDSSDIAFQVAASMAFKKALEEAGEVILEPVMHVEIVVPEEFTGQVTGDINSRRGRVLGMDSKGKNEVVKAQVPLAEMFKYASDLRSVTGGRGSYTMSFAHYDTVPSRVAQTIITELSKSNKEE